MLTAKIQLKQAEKLRNFLFKNQFYEKDYQTSKVLNFIYFPIKSLNPAQRSKLKKQFPALSFTKAPLKKVCRPQSFKQLLKNQLTKHQLQHLPSAQEIVGTIMILEIPKELQSKEKIIAQALLKTNKNIQTIVKKSKQHQGIYRLRKLQHLAGIKTKETIHKENNIKIKLDIEKTYFSTRLANERLRIAKQVQSQEEILVMFSGAAPYPLVLAKNSPAKHITGIEINPLAHQFALQNLELNNIRNKIDILEGDVKDLLPKIKQKFDRILMPLPKTSEQFLSLALTKAKPNTIIHLYAFLDQTELKSEPKKIKNLTKNKVKILRKIQCGQFSPAVSRYCFDLKVL